MKNRKNRNLTQETEAALRKKIADGPIEIGEKLPTEIHLAKEFGVSRTVIREAIAALRAGGLLKAKHGVGVFVSKKSDTDSDAAEANQNAQFTAPILDILELRMAVEVHAAGLAAVRKTWAQEEKIYAAAKRFVLAVEKEEPTQVPDFDFHKSISEATNNEAFPEFFTKIGLNLLPRHSLQNNERHTLINKSYLEKAANEHDTICEAISAGDPTAAREAMESHLGGSFLRYRGLIMAGGTNNDDDDAESGGDGEITQ